MERRSGHPKRSHLSANALAIAAVSLIGTAACSPWIQGDHNIVVSKAETPAQKAEKVRIAAAFRRKQIVEGFLVRDAKTGSLDDFALRVYAMKDLDLTNCPADFAAAYRGHVQAWERAANIQRHLSDLDRRAGETSSSTPRRLLAFTTSSQARAAWREEVDFKAEARRAQQQIHLTFLKVETIALRYGAKLAPDY